MTSKPILPGATLGVLGSGQLGRMFAIAARRMGYRVHVLSPESDTPTGQVADEEIVAAYDDLDAVEAFARRVDVVTFEFENVPAATAAAVAKHTLVRPDGDVLHTTQNRVREKTFLRDAGLPVTPFERVLSLRELTSALTRLGCPAVLKTAAWGYDGKGQAVISDAGSAEAAWAKLGMAEGADEGGAVLEKFIDFDRELSVMGCRGVGTSGGGEFAHFGPFDNSHHGHILDVTKCPAEVPLQTASAAVQIAREVMEKLNCVGVLCVEYFMTEDGDLMINELAPRPHNSGHLTIDAHASDQFEQQVRAICGLPLASTTQLRPAAMANLLGDVWEDAPGREPNWPAAMQAASVRLHLYGKREPRRGRKMGHLTAIADHVDEAAALAVSARLRLTQR